MRTPKNNKKPGIDRLPPEIKKESADRIIGWRPGRISKIAFPIYGCIVLLIVSSLWFIHYPEIVKARVVVRGLSAAGNFLFVEIDFPKNNMYKLELGQSIELRLDNYPVAGFGVLNGKFFSVSDTSAGANVQAQIQLVQGLTTNRQKTIPYKEGLKADIFVVIKDRRLIQRIFNGSKKVTG